MLWSDHLLLPGYSVVEHVQCSASGFTLYSFAIVGSENSERGIKAERENKPSNEDTKPLAGFSYKPDLDICKFVQFAVFGGVCNF
jgi:hypothetical protein